MLEEPDGPAEWERRIVFHEQKKIDTVLIEWKGVKGLYDHHFDLVWYLRDVSGDLFHDYINRSFSNSSQL